MKVPSTHLRFEPRRVRCAPPTRRAPPPGVSLDAWGEPTYHLYVWLWVDPSKRADVEDALRDHHPAPWRNEHGSFLLTLPAPHEGETFQAAGERAAEALWGMVQRVT